MAAASAAAGQILAALLAFIASGRSGGQRARSAVPARAALDLSSQHGELGAGRGCSMSQREFSKLRSDHQPRIASRSTLVP